MMQIVYFSQKSQLWTELQAVTGKVEFITPSPAKADSLRLQLGAAGIAHDVVTIAKFTGGLVENLWEEKEEPPQVKRKADLLLIFGILKNSHFPDLGFEQFMQGYNLFSDLRSFTMDHDALSSVMEEQPLEIQQAVSLFWRLLDQIGMLDEHGAYQAISERLRSVEEVEDLHKTYVFYGFQHLNGQQVDLLKALSIRYPVIIPFPLALKDNLKRTDWLSWLREHKVEESDLPAIVQEPKANWLKVNSREIAHTLKDRLQDGDQVLLGVSKLSTAHLDIIPSQKLSYKIPHQLIEAEISELSRDLKFAFKQTESLSVLEAHLAQMRAELIASKSLNFKKLKAIELYQDSIAVIRDLTEADVALDIFFLKLLYQVVSLNQPRTSYIPMSAHELTIELKDMSSLEDISRARPTYLCIDERFDEIQGLGQNYTEAIQKALSHLGPLKRNELELQFKAWELRDLLSQGQVIILMSASTLEHSLIWKRIFTGAELNEIAKDNNPTERKLQDHFQSIEKKAFSGHYSATKFQSFMDCPRKFYFAYVDPIFPKVGLKQDFDQMDAGTIAHEIIEVFHKRSLTLAELPALTKEIMQKFIKQGGLTLARETYLKREIEFNHRSSNGIRFIEEVRAALGEDVIWKMEEKFDFTSEYKVTGKIDCTGESKETVILIDFKSATVPSKKDVLNYDNLQLWTYAQAASRSIENFVHKNIILGFVSLDKPDNSSLLLSSGEQAARLKGIAKCDVFEGGFKELLDASAAKMTSLTLAIAAEKDFSAIPRTSNACKYCELTKVCVKSVVKRD